MRTRLFYDKVDKYLIYATLLSPMHIGAGSGNRQDILLHPVTGLPFIQASSINGALRDYYERRFGNAEVIFGGQDGENEHAEIKISDGLFSHESFERIEFRPRVKIDPASGSVSSTKIKGSGAVSGHKFDMEYVGVGARFSFSVYDYSDSEFDDGTDQKIRETLAALNNGEIVFGGQKSNGCGSVSISHLYHKRFDLRDPKDRTAWFAEDELGPENYEDIIDNLSDAADSVYRIMVSGKTENAILVKGYQIEGFGKNAPDSVNIQNCEKEYIIPGSSLKGAIRSRVEYIAGALGLDHRVVDGVFGSYASDEEGIAGNARFYDSVIGDRTANDKNEISHRIHVDKFTGGVMYKALFSEKTASGSVNLKIDVLNKNHPERSVGLLLMALRDLANGMYNLGGGSHIGYGYIEVNSIDIQYGKKKARVDFGSGRVEDNDRIIDICLKAVGKGE